MLNKSSPFVKLFHDLDSKTILIPSTLKRCSYAQMSPATSIKRPSGLYVREMFDPQMFQSGDVPVSSTLKSDTMISLHILSCNLCKCQGTIHTDCYFSLMIRCVTHGWKPHISALNIDHRIIPRNAKSTTLFPVEVDSAVTKLLALNTISKIATSEGHFFSPVGVVIKNSDKLRARTLCNLAVTNSNSLATINTMLSLVKVRQTLPGV